MTRPDVYFIGDPGYPTTFEVWDVTSNVLIQDITSLDITVDANAGTVAELRFLNAALVKVNVVPKAHKFTMVDIGKAVECQDSRGIVRGKISEIYINQPHVINVIDDQGNVWCFHNKDVALLPTPAGTCPECKGTGTYTCALTAKESPCSLGCKRFKKHGVED